MYVHVNETEFGDSADIQTLINAHRNLQTRHGRHDHSCPSCGCTVTTLSRRCLTAPILLNVSIGKEYLTLNQFNLLIINPIIFLDGVSYSLSSVIYGDGSHFITRFLFGGQAYHGDGMRTTMIEGKNYQRTDCLLLQNSVGDIPFPGHILRTRYYFSHVEYIRTDSLA